MCYADPQHIYDAGDSSDDEKAREHLSQAEIEAIKSNPKINLVGEQHEWKMLGEMREGTDDCMIRYHKHLN
jgi:hypothetical protein